MPALSELRESPVGAFAGEAWRWWTGELMAMVPERYRPDAGKAARSEIRPRRDAVEIEIVSEGIGQRFADTTRLEDLTAEGWAELATLIEGSRARIVLDAPDAFHTSLMLPAAARRRLRSAVALQLSQVSPVEPALLRWATAPIESGADKIGVRVAMARSDRIEALRTLFEANGIDPPPICAATPEGPVELARGARISGKASDRIRARDWAIAVLLIATIPLTTTLGATLLRAGAQDRIEVLEKGAAPRLEAEAKARQAEELRRDLRPLVTRPSITATLEELAIRLPPTDHVKSISQAGDRILLFTVETADAEAAEAALRGSRILPHVAVTDVVPATGGRLAANFRTSPR